TIRFLFFMLTSYATVIVQYRTTVILFIHFVTSHIFLKFIFSNFICLFLYEHQPLFLYTNPTPHRLLFTFYSVNLSVILSFVYR
ncbi:hypothetical protein L9F63_007014, partial [Diploptera punctata]